MRPSKTPEGKLVKSQPDRSSDVSAVSSSKVPEGKLVKSFQRKSSVVSAVSSSKTPEGKVDKSLSRSLSVVSAVSPSKSPDFNDAIDSCHRSSEVIVARCCFVTLSAESTPSIAATIASCTCCVRWLTCKNPSWTSITLMVTVMLSLPPLPSEAETVTE